MSVILFLLSSIIGLLFIVAHILISVWAYRDAIKRGNSKEYAIVLLAAILIFPILNNYNQSLRDYIIKVRRRLND